MIEISNSKAEEILIVLGDLRRMAWDKKGNRAANMRRRAKLIENYLTKKKDNYGKRKRIERPHQRGID
jgi:hypothetical protein